MDNLPTTAALNGLSRYLAQQGQIKTPLPRRSQPIQLAEPRETIRTAGKMTVRAAHAD